MGGRTMPTECPHGDRPENGVCNHCLAHAKLAVLERRDRKRTPSLVSRFPAEAVAQLVEDGVLVPAGWRRGSLPLGHPRQRGAIEGSRPDGEGWELMYGVVLPEEGEDS